VLFGPVDHDATIVGIEPGARDVGSVAQPVTRLVAALLDAGNDICIYAIAVGTYVECFVAPGNTAASELRNECALDVVLEFGVGVRSGDQAGVLVSVIDETVIGIAGVEAANVDVNVAVLGNVGVVTVGALSPNDELVSCKHRVGPDGVTDHAFGV